jgi:hypothetical protein
VFFSQQESTPCFFISNQRKEETMRGILIDPKAKTITEVEHDKNYKQIYEFIGADCFQGFYHGMDGNDMMYVDDMGLFRENQSYFMWMDYEQPIPGKGLILGIEGDDSTDTTLTIAEVTKRVTWTNKEFVGTSTRTGTVNDPVFGQMGLIEQTAHFKDK